MDKEQNFIAARFQYLEPRARAIIVWTGPDRISVAVQLLGLNEAGSQLDKTWRIAAAETQKIQTNLSRVTQHPIQAGGDYVLDLDGPNGKPTRLSWSPATETELLSQIRNDFEKLSHMHYTEALAALAVGRNLVGRGKQKDAIDAFRIGIEALGNRYSSLEIIDDTGAKLTLAEHNLSTGKLAEAAALFGRVLEARTLVYEQRFKPEG